jgi:hypothetical protein
LPDGVIAADSAVTEASSPADFTAAGSAVDPTATDEAVAGSVPPLEAPFLADSTAAGSAPLAVDVVPEATGNPIAESAVADCAPDVVPKATDYRGSARVILAVLAPCRRRRLCHPCGREGGRAGGGCGVCRRQG